jgi:hypothetical protein
LVPRRLLCELQPWSVLLLAPWEPQLGTADGPWPTRRHHCGGGVQCALEDPPNPGDGLFVERDVAFSALPTGVGPPHSQPMPLRVRCSSWHRLRSGKAVAAEGHCQCFTCRVCHLQWASGQSGAQGRPHTAQAQALWPERATSGWHLSYLPAAPSPCTTARQAFTRRGTAALTSSTPAGRSCGSFRVVAGCSCCPGRPHHRQIVGATQPGMAVETLAVVQRVPRHQLPL